MPDRRAVLLEGGTCSPTGNKGDELMLLAVLRALTPYCDAFDLVGHLQSGPYIQRAELGLHQLLWQQRRSRLSGWLGYPVLRRYGRPFGIVADEELHAVINFMGYRYADFGARELHQDCRRNAARRRRGTRIVFLPQAYGPFERAESRRDAIELFERADLVFARDRHSVTLLRGAGVRTPITVSPDITIPIPGVAPAYWLPNDFMVMIPNLWMVERVPQNISQRYVSFLSDAGAWALSNGLDVVILSHSDFQDAPIAAQLEAQLHNSNRVRLILEKDALQAKGLIGQARVVVGSRYHGLVAGLSQCVPTIGTSWAHKYAGLFEDYRCTDNLLDPTIETAALWRHLDTMIQPVSRDRLLENLESCNQQLVRQVGEMWSRIFHVIGASSATE